MAKKRKIPAIAKIRAWLKAHGHKPSDVDGLNLSTAKERKKAILGVHQKLKTKS